MSDPLPSADPWPPEFGPGLYVHIPLCRSRCSYCDFYSETEPEARLEPLLANLAREAEGRAAEESWSRCRFRSVYVGGGTPSLLGGAGMARLLAVLRRCFRLDDAAEITAEANPESLTPQVMRAWASEGVNRVSLGAQSLEDAELRLLDRRHDGALVHRRVEELRAAGIRRISLDLIYGVPGSDLRGWERTVRGVLALGIEHLSAYLLTLEAGVPMQRRVESGDLRLPDDDAARAQYERLGQLAAASGLEAYEISSFARPGEECRHNQNYWVRGEYLGLGPSAHSHRAGRRWSNPASSELWSERLALGLSPADPAEEVDASGVLAEWLFLGLRRSEGVPWRVLQQAAPSADAVTRLLRRTSELSRHGLVESGAGWLRLTPRARFLSSGVFSDLMAVVS